MVAAVSDGGRPVTVADLVAFAGDRVAVMPALYHLLWRGVLAVDLRRRLSRVVSVDTSAGGRAVIHA